MEVLRDIEEAMDHGHLGSLAPLLGLLASGLHTEISLEVVMLYRTL